MGLTETIAITLLLSCKYAGNHQTKTSILFFYYACFISRNMALKIFEMKNYESHYETSITVRQLLIIDGKTNMS